MEKMIFGDSSGHRGENIPNRGFIMNFLITKGIVKTESSANVLMTIVSLIFLIWAGYVIYTSFFYKGNPADVQNSPIQQKTQEYIKSGMKFPEARRKAMEDVRLQNNINNTNSTTN